MPRVAHLSGPAAFKAVLAQPALAKSEHFSLHVLRSSAAQGLSCAAGVLVPKRWAKRAVSRNAIRRQAYVWLHGWLDAHSAPAGHTAEHVIHAVVRMRTGFATQHGESAASASLKRTVRAELLEMHRKASQRWAGMPELSA
jgi:ribonuclease P protein component